MTNLFWLTLKQMKRIEHYFPLSHKAPHVDDRCVISRILHVIRNGLHRQDAHAEYGPHKTIYSRFVLEIARRLQPYLRRPGWEDGGPTP